MTSGERADTAGKKAASVRDDATSATKNDHKPSFTPTETTAAPTPAPSAPTASTSPAGSDSSYSGSSYTPQTSYSRSDWSTGLNPAPAPAPAAAGSTATASAAAPDSTGSQARNGYSSSMFSGAGAAGSAATGTASAIGGAAAGLANSVTSAWQKRGSAPKAPRGIQTRKSTKRQAMLTLARVEPWSVMKFSFVASVVAFIILFVAVAVLYMVLAALGVFDSIQHTVTTMTSAQGAAGTNISHWTSPSLILGYTAMLGALNIVLITAMATVGSVIYNLIAKTIGGIEVTLRETD